MGCTTYSPASGHKDAVDEGLHSEVILGIKPLKIGYDFASGIPAADVVRIADAIELVDINALIRAADSRPSRPPGSTRPYGMKTLSSCETN